MADTVPVDDGRGPNIGGGADRASPPADPTDLTTQALYREVAGLKELIQQSIKGVEATVDEKFATVDSRLVAIDAATELRLKTIEDIPHRIDEKTAHLRELHDEKFASIATQFAERDTRSERESRDNKVAVDAAFAAQKEAAAKQEETFSKGIDKSEAATTETINKLAELFRTTTDAISAKVEDLKERVSDVDKRVNGSAQQKVGGQDTRAMIGWVLAAIVAIGTIVTLAIAFKPV